MQDSLWFYLNWSWQNENSSNSQNTIYKIVFLMHPAMWKRKENRLQNVKSLFWIKGWAKTSGTLPKSRLSWTQNTELLILFKRKLYNVEHLVKPEI